MNPFLTLLANAWGDAVPVMNQADEHWVGSFYIEKIWEAAPVPYSVQQAIFFARQSAWPSMCSRCGAHNGRWHGPAAEYYRRKTDWQHTKDDCIIELRSQLDALKGALEQVWNVRQLLKPEKFSNFEITMVQPCPPGKFEVYERIEEVRS